MLTNQSLSDIRKYVTSYTEQELQINAFREYLSSREISWNESDSLSQLAQLFDSREFPEFSAKSEYFIRSIHAIKNHFDEFCEIEKILRSPKSKETFLCLLRAKLCIDTESLLQAFSLQETQYFRTDYFVFEQGEVYVDCGAYTGDTILELIHYAPDYQKIYAFEASKHIRERLEQPFGMDGSIVFSDKAVANITGEILPFSDLTRKGDGVVSQDGDDRVESVKLDDVISERVTFIKMDIEGYEIPAINGARRIISENTPKMAICVYHRENDFWEIPKLILSINPNYEFEIGQYRAYEFWDTILYCIPTKSEKFPVQEISAQKIAERTKLLRLKTQMISHDEFNFLNDKYEESTWLKTELGKSKRYVHKLEQQIKELIKKNQELSDWAKCLEIRLEQQNSEWASKNKELELWGLKSKRRIEDLMNKNKAWFEWAKSLGARL